MKEVFEFLKELQKQMKYEDEHDNDIQASPRFWTIMDYRTVPTHEDYGFDRYSYFHNDGDCVEFKTVDELKEYLRDYHVDSLEGNKYEELKSLLDDDEMPVEFDELWNFVEAELNEDDYFNSCPVKEESYIVPDTMFITKEDAKNHLKVNHYHYSSKAHTYAMTAWRSPKVDKLWDILLNFDFDKVDMGRLSLEENSIEF